VGSTRIPFSGIVLFTPSDSPGVPATTDLPADALAGAFLLSSQSAYTSFPPPNRILIFKELLLFQPRKNF